MQIYYFLTKRFQKAIELVSGPGHFVSQSRQTTKGTPGRGRLQDGPDSLGRLRGEGGVAAHKVAVLTSHPCGAGKHLAGSERPMGNTCTANQKSGKIKISLCTHYG